MKTFYLIVGCAILSVASLLLAERLVERWPALPDQQAYKSIVDEKLAEYRTRGAKPSLAAQSYASGGPYLGYSTTRYSTGGRIKLDSDGYPMINYNGAFYYNPVTISQYALAEYSRGTGPSNRFIPAANKLLTLQDSKGGFLYPFEFANYINGEMYEPGWTSGMAQGQALSVLARAFHLTKEPKYLAAGSAALEFMVLDRELGGTGTTLADLNPSLDRYPFIMQYPQTPAVYTLNGYMFSLLGLHDWAALTKSSKSKALFEKHVKTLLKILPYFDIGGFTAYDLGFIVHPKMKDGSARLPHVSATYHLMHIDLLWALHSATSEEAIAETAKRWTSYVSQ